MVLSIYSIAYLLSLTGLVLWFFFQKDRKLSKLMSTLFLGSFVVYAFSLAFSPGEFGGKLWILFRDLMVLGAASQIFIWVGRSKWTFFALLFMTYGSYFAFYQDYQKSSLESIAIPSETLDNAVGFDNKAEFLVELRDKNDIDRLRDYLENQKWNARIKQAFELEDQNNSNLDEYVSIDFSGNALDQLSKIQTEINNLDFVIHSEINELIKFSPDESEIEPKRKMDFSNDPELQGQWAYDPMDIEKVHQLLAKITPPKGPANIAIIDTGVDASHEDLKDVYYSIDSNSDKDAMGHGTHCAGIAAAVSNNGLGVSSMSPTNKFIRVTSIKVFGNFGGATQEAVINGMLKAADAGVAVISMSLGGISSDARQKAYNDAVKYCNKKNAIVVVAAGNSNTDAKNYSPANSKGVIAVGAIAPGLVKANYSNTVDNLQMGISAPGSNILSTYPKSTYKSLNGTSMACPQVAGLLGIMKSLQPDLNTKEAYKLLKTTGKKGTEFEKVGSMIQPFNVIKSIVD